MTRISELLLYNDKLEMNDHLEADLLYEVCPFLNRACRDKEVKVLFSERASVADVFARNEERARG